MLSAIVTTDLHVNEPLYFTPPNVMKAKKKLRDTVKPEDLGVDVSPRLKTMKVVEPAKRSAGIIVPDVAPCLPGARSNPMSSDNH